MRPRACCQRWGRCSSGSVAIRHATMAPPTSTARPVRARSSRRGRVWRRTPRAGPRRPGWRCGCPSRPAPRQASAARARSRPAARPVGRPRAFWTEVATSRRPRPVAEPSIDAGRARVRHLVRHRDGEVTEHEDRVEAPEDHEPGDEDLAPALVEACHGKHRERSRDDQHGDTRGLERSRGCCAAGPGRPARSSSAASAPASRGSRGSRARAPIAAHPTSSRTTARSRTSVPPRARLLPTRPPPAAGYVVMAPGRVGSPVGSAGEAGVVEAGPAVGPDAVGPDVGALPGPAGAAFCVAGLPFRPPRTQREQRSSERDQGRERAREGTEVVDRASRIVSHN